MKKIIFFILIVLLFSCGRNSKVPEHVIPQEDMVNIIVDLHITDGMFTVVNIRKRLATDTIKYYNAIFSNHGYTRTDFDSSISFYSRNIDVYDKIYEEVLNKLNELETNIKQEKAEEDNQRKLNQEESKKKKTSRVRDE